MMNFNISKEKIVNLFLRIIQLSIQLITGFWVARNGEGSKCDYTIPNIISYISYGLGVLNLASLVALQYGRRFPKLLFFLVLVFDGLAAIGVIVVEARKGSSQCASVTVFQEFSIIESGNALIIVAGIVAL
jgi:hypothetical protein